MAFRGSSFQNFSGGNTPGPPYIGCTFSARMFSPPNFTSFLSLLRTLLYRSLYLAGLQNLGIPIVSQNFKKLGEHIPGLCPPHILERIVALAFQPSVYRAVARALIGGGVYIHIFVLCPTNFF